MLQVENVKQRCLPNALNYPMLEEYDFRNDTVRYSLSVHMQFIHGAVLVVFQQCNCFFTDEVFLNHWSH